MPFTTVVMNGKIMTSLTVHILPFTPLRLYSGMFRPFMVFCLDITVLRCTCFHVSSACCNSFSVIVTTTWPMTWVPICTTKNNTSSLYQGKCGIVRWDSMYPLYGIEMPPIPFNTQHTPYQIPQWQDPQPLFCTESLSEGRDLGPCIHQCHYPQPIYQNHSLIGIIK